MKIGDQTRHVISTSSKNTMIGDRPKKTQEVVYKTYIGKHKGKPIFDSQLKNK